LGVFLGEFYLFQVQKGAVGVSEMLYALLPGVPEDFKGHLKDLGFFFLKIKFNLL
jgi:hypothetical protein